MLCVDRPQDYIPQLGDYSLMVVSPNASAARKKYLLNQADWSLLITDHDQQHRGGGDYGDEKILWYTSGTTGDSKFYGFSQAQIDQRLQNLQRSYDITANDRYVSVMPLHHAHGQLFYFLSQAVGFEISFLDIRKIKQLTNFSPTFITAIPGVLRLISHLQLKDLRFIRSASAAMPNELYHSLKQKFQVPVIEAFGMTEALSHCFTNPLHGEQRIGTIGLPDGVEARLDNQHLFLKGAACYQQDWFDTGDLAQQDDAGYYRILGRSQEQINVNGFKINPVSIENQLLRYFADMKECVVFGSDRLKCLFVGDCTEGRVKEFLCELDAHCNPTFLSQVDFIPCGEIGKISRSWLNERY